MKREATTPYPSATPVSIAPEDIRVGDRVARRREHPSGDVTIDEFTVTKVDTDTVRSEFGANRKRIGTWTLLNRPAPPMQPLPTEPGSVIWVDAIDDETLDEPVKAMLDVDDYWLFPSRVDGWGARKSYDITAWHAVTPEYRTVSTAEELDALLVGAVIRSAGGTVAERLGSGLWCVNNTVRRYLSNEIVALWTPPFTVLWEGEK